MEIGCFDVRDDHDPKYVGEGINEQLKKLGIHADNVISVTPPTHLNPDTMRVFYKRRYLARR
jgi:hypothetical protein